MKNTPQILSKNTPHVWVIIGDENSVAAGLVVGCMRVMFTGHTVHADINLHDGEVFTSISQKHTEDYAICLVASQLIRKFGEEFKNDDFVQALHCNTLTDINTRFSELGYDVTKIF
jgi:hypothetical protein